MTTNIKTYSELIRLPTLIERYRYLRLSGKVGEETFGFDRYLNQNFYKSKEWLRIRDHVILRDGGCDMGLDGHYIYEKILIHHMNPITKDDIINRSDFLLNPEYLICVTDNTHKAIHYGDETMLSGITIMRTKNDTCPWRKEM